jgi:hypothetical protein
LPIKEGSKEERKEGEEGGRNKESIKKPSRSAVTNSLWT